MRKRISLLTVETLPWWLQLFGVLIGASTDAGRHEEDAFCGIPNEEIVGSRSLTEVAFAALVGAEPTPDSLFAFQTLVGLLLSNGPGTISAQDRKSTRLNSSHANISYAVFCLKKKNKQKTVNSSEVRQTATRPTSTYHPSL